MTYLSIVGIRDGGGAPGGGGKPETFNHKKKKLRKYAPKVKSKTKLLRITTFSGDKHASLCYNGQKKMEFKLINRHWSNKTLNEQSCLLHRAQTGSQDTGLIFSTTHSPFCEYEKVTLNALPFPSIKQ